MPERRKLYTVTELAERLGVSISVVSRRIVARGIEPAERRGAAKLFGASALRGLKPRPRGRPRRVTS